ncbi:MAG TPA: DNA primase [Petrimonas sp.]|nr:DNA primase [Petrimonas sp.]
MIPQQTIDNILQAADIVDVVSGYVSLHQSGANFKCICPFHEDRDASLVVSRAKNIWKCFGCGKGGNAINFVMEHENMSFPEAVKTVADKYHITVPERELTDEEREQYQHRESLYIALDFAHEHFISGLQQKEAQEYLATRNIPDEILKLYGAGFAKKSFTLLRDTALQKGYSTTVLIETGLVSASEKDNKTYDRFINRITFPFYNLSGKIIGFTGRAVETDERSPKYLNSPDTELFSKSNTLFGLLQARQAIAQRDKCYFVEGQFDVLSFAAAGLPNTVCGSGTAFTRAQAKMLRKFTKNVTVIYDGDAAGMKASIRSIDILLQAGINVRAAILPDGEDPDSFARKMGETKLKKWLKKNEVDFITFIYKTHEEELSDPIRKTEVLELVAKTIANVPDKLAQSNYIQNLSTLYKVDDTILTNLVSKLIPTTPPVKIADAETDKCTIHGIEDAQSFLGQGKKELTVTFDQDIYAQDWGAAPTVYITGEPDINEIQELRSVAYVIKCRDKFNINDDLDEPLGISVLKNLSKSGFTVTITETKNRFEEDESGSRKKIEREEKYGFTEYYISLYAEFRHDTEYIQRQAVERCAELISFAPATTRTLKMKDYAAQLGIAKTALEEIVKHHLDLRKSETQFRNDGLSGEEDSEYVHFNLMSVPDYVEEDDDLRAMYRTYGFFPMLDKNNRKVAYIFQQKGSFIRVGNFYIEPLLHIYSKESAENKRIVELTQRRIPYPLYMEWISKDMITAQSFAQRLWDEGDINFSNGTQQILNTIRESWEGKFRKCTELRMYGYYDEGFFAFSNAIYHEVKGEYKIDQVDELGLVEHNGFNYYIPAFSKIYASERRDSDKYFLDRFMMYRKQKNSTDFNEWSALMNEVYKYNHNGKWAILYAFMCLFRSDIFDVDRIFTALFFIGPTGSGKSEIAYSIRAIFMPREAPVFDLNSGTAAALFTLMEKYRNIPLMLEEYNDQQIDDVKFQGLKSAVYAGEGKQKRKDAASKEIDSSEVNAPLIIMGQESPQRDDNSLSNRCIICDVPKKDDRTETEDEIFRKLKNMEKEGLHDILLQLLKLRGIVREKYPRIQREVYKELKDNIRGSITNTDGLSRILNTSSMFLATCKIIESHTELKLPFTYDEFFEIASEKVLRQVESISTSNRMHGFFTTINTLIDRGNIKEGRDFKIHAPGKITLQKQGRETYLKVLDPSYMRILHLNISSIHYEYLRCIGKEALSMQSLMSYMQSHEAYIGRTRSTRFEWEEVVETYKDAPFRTEDGDLVDTGNSTKRIMQKKQSTTTSVVLNYDILQELLNVDYERNPADADGQPDTDQDEELEF